MPSFTLKHFSVSCCAIGLMTLFGCNTTSSMILSENVAVVASGSQANQASQALTNLLDTIWSYEM